VHRRTTRTHCSACRLLKPRGGKPRLCPTEQFFFRSMGCCVGRLGDADDDRPSTSQASTGMPSAGPDGHSSSFKAPTDGDPSYGTLCARPPHAHLFVRKLRNLAENIPHTPGRLDAHPTRARLRNCQAPATLGGLLSRPGHELHDTCVLRGSIAPVCRELNHPSSGSIGMKRGAGAVAWALHLWGVARRCRRDASPRES
jgi:hypothetical protein